MRKGTDKYLHCNHHHELTEEQESIDCGTGEFVADKTLIELLRALNETGLKTRSHCCGHGSEAFIAISMDSIESVEIRHVVERNSTRDAGGQELFIVWKVAL